jgi:hypothetical protein
LGPQIGTQLAKLSHDVPALVLLQPSSRLALGLSVAQLDPTLNALDAFNGFLDDPD